MLGVMLCGHRGTGSTTASKYIAERYRQKGMRTEYRHIEQPLYELIQSFDIGKMQYDSIDIIRESILDELGEGAFSHSAIKYFQHRALSAVVIDGVWRMADFMQLQKVGFYAIRIDPDDSIPYICCPEVPMMATKWSVTNTGDQKKFLTDLEIPLHQIMLEYDPIKD